jgi:hypothetical protein
LTVTRESEPDRIATEVQRLNAGVYRWVVRTLVVVLLMSAFMLAFLAISLDVVDVVVVVGVSASLVTCIIALSYNIRKLRLIARIGKEAYLQQERAGLSRRPPLSRRMRIVYITAFGAILMLELILQIVRLAVLRH